MKNSADLGGCYPQRPKAEVDNTLLDLRNSSYPTQPHSIIAKYSNSFKNLSEDLEFSNPLQAVFSILYNVASETYVWSFQYKLLNNILFTNTKLFKIGLIESEKCSFCTIYKEDKETKWNLLYCCHGNTLGSSLFLCKTKYPRLQLFWVGQGVFLGTDMVPTLS